MYDIYEPDYSSIEPEPPQRFYSTQGMSVRPINPKNLVPRVNDQLESYGLVVPTQTSLMVADLCRGFNQCIQDNKKRNTQTTYVYSPKTGSAKSVTAKMYVSMLKKESSIIVVSTVADALEFCDNINDWSNNRNYARCYYTISETNPDVPSLRVEKKDLYKSRCIVITHNMFIRENTQSYNDQFQKYKGSKRDLVIVDERIALYQRHTISKLVIEDLIRICNILSHRISVDLKDDIHTLNEIVRIYDEIAKLASCSKSTDILIDESHRKTLNIPTCKFTNLIKASKNTSIDIYALINPIRSKTNSKEDMELRKDIQNYLRKIEYVMDNAFSFHKGKSYSYLMSTENIISKFGSSVILDATATVNEIYTTTAWHNPDTFKHIETVDPRIYKNFIINKANGYPQGANSIYEGLESKELKQRVDDYLATANEVLTKTTDKLLIICHKDFKLKLEAKNTNPNIVFTNWGNHVGKNLWSDCNKVMVIGWYYLPKVEYFGNFINAVGSLHYAKGVLEKDTLTKYRTSQLADDLVQAVMRGSARKTISADGNCAISEAYIFYPDNVEGNTVMNLFEDEFKGATVKQWNPKKSSKLKKLPKRLQNIQTIIDYLDRASTKSENVSQADVVKGTGLAGAQVSRAFNSPIFNDLLIKKVILK